MYTCTLLTYNIKLSDIFISLYFKIDVEKKSQETEKLKSVLYLDIFQKK